MGKHHSDFLIIGSGIAGLTYALKLAQHLPEAKVSIVTKGAESESNTRYAQGGIAVVLNEIADSFEKHIEDTLIAGDRLCNRAVVEVVVREGPERLKELINWGVNFDTNPDGHFDMGLEGGHTQNRILHHSDITGFEIETKLLARIRKQPNIQVFTNHLAVDLITNEHLADLAEAQKAKACHGAYILNAETDQISAFTARITLLATGGVGQVYQNTTNPAIATGDGIAMAYRANAEIKGMEFIQFHPTALKFGSQSPSFLISEAVRGFGAKLLNGRGERFMDKYDTRMELASRDIVSRAIHSEMNSSGDKCVYLDCSHLDIVKFKGKFSTIYSTLMNLGIDVSKDLIPVVPAAHYLCGGIDVDLHGQTSVANLLACGECAHTGLHGGNRLASNSLLEALVFANRSYVYAVAKWKEIEIPHIHSWSSFSKPTLEEDEYISHSKQALQQLMSTHVGIIRCDKQLQEATCRISQLTHEVNQIYNNQKASVSLVELRNLLIIASLIVNQSKVRIENRGVFFKEFTNVGNDLKAEISIKKIPA